jgi:exodeoxyribonuclease VII small subunit
LTESATPEEAGTSSSRNGDSIRQDPAGVQAEVATYELARDELAAVVAKLESGGLSLDESLTLWERGEHLAAVCARFLEGARERVETALARTDQPD